MKPENKKCQNCKKNFTIESEDFAFYEKMKVPAPTFCPECRLIRRLAWRNEKSFHNRTCDECKKSIISVFPLASGLVVYCSECWWSDQWDGLSFGVDFDESKPLFKQIESLLKKVPMMNLFGLYSTLINSQYTNMVGNLKNCYLLTNSDNNENCLYGSSVDRSNDIVDNLMVDQSELCYENVNCRKCYKTIFSTDCTDCNQISFSRNCIDCSNCVGCVNLRHKSHCIFNEQYSKEEYDKKIKELNLNSHSGLQKVRESFAKIKDDFPQKYIHERHNSNVSGDYIYHSKNAFNSFSVADVEDSRFCSFITPGKFTNGYDFTHYGSFSDLMYETLQAGDQVARILFSWFVVSSAREIEYGMFNIGCSNCFGCIGLKKKKYCILNKQYSKEEYHDLIKKIKKQMTGVPYVDKHGLKYRYGEFFPIELSPFGYNETTAQEYFPLTSQVAEKKGYHWKEEKERDYKITIKSQDLPGRISDVSNEITEEVIGCEHQGKCNENCTIAFKIIPAELQFYKKMNIPLPKLCSNCRHYQRLEKRNPLKLWKRTCMKKGCKTKFETTYSPERKEIIYCKKCYQQEVV